MMISAPDMTVPASAWAACAGRAARFSFTSPIPKNPEKAQGNFVGSLAATLRDVYEARSLPVCSTLKRKAGNVHAQAPHHFDPAAERSRRADARREFVRHPRLQHRVAQ